MVLNFVIVYYLEWSWSLILALFLFNDLLVDMWVNEKVRYMDIFSLWFNQPPSDCSSVIAKVRIVIFQTFVYLWCQSLICLWLILFGLVNFLVSFSEWCQWILGLGSDTLPSGGFQYLSVDDGRPRSASPTFRVKFCISQSYYFHDANSMMMVMMMTTRRVCRYPLALNFFLWSVRRGAFLFLFFQDDSDIFGFDKTLDRYGSMSFCDYHALEDEMKYMREPMASAVDELADQYAGTMPMSVARQTKTRAPVSLFIGVLLLSNMILDTL